MPPKLPVKYGRYVASTACVLVQRLVCVTASLLASSCLPAYRKSLGRGRRMMPVGQPAFTKELHCNDERNGLLVYPMMVPFFFFYLVIIP